MAVKISTVEMNVAYVVRNSEGSVVVCFWGADASEEAATWRDKGYAVELVVESALVGAA